MEWATGNLCRGSVEIGIGEDHLRPLAAEFQPDALDVLSGKAADDAADTLRAGEVDDIDARMFGKKLADISAIAGDDVEHAIGQAGIARQLRHADRRARGEFARLDDDGASGADCPGDTL